MTGKPANGLGGWWGTWRPFWLAWVLTGVLLPIALSVGLGMYGTRAPLLVLFPLGAVAGMVRGHVPFEVAGYVSLAVTLGLLCELPLYALVARLGARRGNARRAAAAIGALHLFAMGLGGPFFWGPSLHAYGRVLREAAGADSRDCGVVPLPQRRDGAVSCAQAALAEGAPFSVAFQVMGIDSTIYVGLAYRADGTPARIVWDSDVSGGYNLVPIRKIHKEDCSKPSIANADDSPRLSCGGDPGGA